LGIEHSLLQGSKGIIFKLTASQEDTVENLVCRVVGNARDDEGEINHFVETRLKGCQPWEHLVKGLNIVVRSRVYEIEVQRVENQRFHLKELLTRKTPSRVFQHFIACKLF